MKKVDKADLLQGTLELLALRLLRSGPLNGWEMMQRLSTVSGEILTVTPGSLYPALHRLETAGYVAAEWGVSENNRRAKFYRLTVTGRRQLEAERQTWERFVGAVGTILREA
jgi:PadR family transcriptional regulator, regulatory protein PadR